MASREKLRWGVLGTADIAIRQVIPATQQSRTGRVAAIASRTEARAAEVARMLDIERHYGSYEQLLADPDVDAIYIPLPNSMHLEWAIKSAEAGKHILCEKPLGITADECRQMVKAARENNVLLTEAFWYRHHPQNLLVKDLIAQGTLGELKIIRGSLQGKAPDTGNNIRFSAELAGGTLLDGGCYPVNLCRWLYQREPTVVSAMFEHDDRFKVDVAFYGILKFGDGQFGFASSGYRHARNVSYEVYGDRGSASVESFMTADHKSTTVRLVIDGEASKHKFPPVNAYTLQADSFAECVREGTEPLTPAADAIKNMAVIEALFESGRTGRHIALPAEAET